MDENKPPSTADLIDSFWSEEAVRLRSERSTKNFNEYMASISEERRTRWSRDKWIAAADAREKGYRPPKKHDPYGLWPGGAFQTAEQIQEALSLDYLPETEEAYTVPRFDGAEPYLLKFCWIELRDSLILEDCAEPVHMDDQEKVMTKGKRRLVYMVRKMKKDPKKIKLKYNQAKQSKEA